MTTPIYGKPDPLNDAIARVASSFIKKKRAENFIMAEDAKRRETFRLIDLTIADSIVITHAGDFVVSDNQSTGVVAIMPNEQGSAPAAAMNFYPGASYKGPFSSLRISWVSQPGATARIIFGKGIEFKPGIGKTNAYNARNAYLAPINLLASIGNISAVQLWNKSTPIPSSGNTPIDLYVRKIIISMNAAQQYAVRMAKGTLPNVAVATSQKYQSGLNVNYYGAAEVRYVNQVTPPAGYVDMFLGYASANVNIVHDFGERPYILGPLGGITVTGTLANSSLAVTYEYEEVTI